MKKSKLPLDIPQNCSC